jgi:hypothetical protein
MTPKHIYTLKTGHRADRGGPVVSTKEGRVLWFTQEPEAHGHGVVVYPLMRIMLRASADGGRSWGEPLLVTQGTPEYGVLTHAAVQLRSGDLVHIFSRLFGYDEIGHDPDKSGHTAHIQRSCDGGATWTEPELLPTGVPYVSDVLSMVQTSSGRVIYPFGFLTKVRRGLFMASVIYSDDEAHTWRRSPSVLAVGGEGGESGASEPSVVELPDGRLWMLIRAQTGFLWESFSADRGETWTAARPSRLPSSSAPGTALRLACGKIVLVWNNHVHRLPARRSLFIGATDDGQTFYGFREIEHTEYPDEISDPARTHVTYPYLCEAPDGSIIVSYAYGTWSANRAKVARIDPRWLDDKEMVETLHDGQAEWCAADPHALGSLVAGHAGPWLQVECTESPSRPLQGLTRNLLLLHRGSMQVTVHVVKPEAFLVWHNSYLYPGQIDDACLRVRFAAGGRVFMAAGSPEVDGVVYAGGDWATYSHLAYPIRDEVEYPRQVAPGEVLTLTLRIRAAEQTASFVINDGPEVAVRIGNILGLCYFGIAAATSGAIRLAGFQLRNDGAA